MVFKKTMLLNKTDVVADLGRVPKRYAIQKGDTTMLIRVVYLPGQKI